MTKIMALFATSALMTTLSFAQGAPEAGLEQVEQAQKVEVQELAPGYLPLVKDASLLNSGCKIKDIPGKGKVLMAVGVIAVKPSQIPGQSLALAIAGAQANARAEMTKFLYGVQNQTATEVHDMLEVKTFTREEAEGFVRNAQQRGQWIAKDGSVLGVLLVLERGSGQLANEFINEMKDFSSMPPDGALEGAPVGQVIGESGTVGSVDPDYEYN